MKIHKPFIYLLHSGRKNVEKHLELVSDASDLLVVTYDAPFEYEGDIAFKRCFLPNSSINDSRNKLCEMAKSLPEEYLYYIFIDDDVEFATGGWQQFQNRLLEYSPAIGHPLMEKVYSLLNKYFKICIEKYLTVQRASITDQQVEALHRDVFYDGLIYPTFTIWDEVSWWYSCILTEMLKINFYKKDMLQFNDCRILNAEHGQYPQSMNKRLLHTIFNTVNALGGIYGVDQHYYKAYADRNFNFRRLNWDLLILSNKPCKGYKTKSDFSIENASVYRRKIWELSRSIEQGDIKLEKGDIDI